MLKRFFISMLGTVAGVFISGMLAVFIIVALVGTIAGKSLGEKAVLKSIPFCILNLTESLPREFRLRTLWI